LNKEEKIRDYLHSTSSPLEKGVRGIDNDSQIVEFKNSVYCS